MARGRESVSLDLMLRAAGLALALIGYVAVRHLVDHYPLPRHHHASFADGVCAAVGFLGFSASSVLALYGGHVFDEIAVSRRWARRSPGHL